MRERQRSLVMPVMLRMAFRNLVQHKAKSLIVGMLLALGMLIMVLGNSFLDASKRGIESSFTRNYTGDVIITGIADGPVSLFGVQSVGGLESTPTIPDYEKVYEYASSIPGVQTASGMGTSFGLLTNEAGDIEQADDESDDKDMMSAFVMLFGVDAGNYWKLFNEVELEDGEYLRPGQSGIMLASDRIEKIGKYLNRDLKVGDELLIQGMGGSGMRLRSAKIVGTFKRVSDSAGPEQLTYIDIDTLRVLSGMTVGASENIELSSDQTDMLAIEDLDSIFGDDSFGMIESGESAGRGTSFNEASIASLLGDTSARDRLNTADTGAWHSILLRLDDPGKTRSVVAGLNAWFDNEGIPAQAGDWQKAAGPYAQSVDVLRIVFTVAIVILAIVAIIIIMNTLVVSIIERTGEIGTMRALGGSRGFVRSLFAAETVTLSLVFGIVGIALSFLVAAIVNGVGIEATNEFLQILFGGKVLRAVINPLMLLGSMLIIIMVGLVASIYPVSVALRIQPVQAMQA